MFSVCCLFNYFFVLLLLISDDKIRSSIKEFEVRCVDLCKPIILRASNDAFVSHRREVSGLAAQMTKDGLEEVKHEWMAIMDAAREMKIKAGQNSSALDTVNSKINAIENRFHELAVEMKSTQIAGNDMLLVTVDNKLERQRVDLESKSEEKLEKRISGHVDKVLKGVAMNSDLG